MIIDEHSRVRHISGSNGPFSNYGINFDCGVQVFRESSEILTAALSAVYIVVIA